MTLDYVQEQWTWWGPTGVVPDALWVSNFPVDPAYPAIHALVIPAWVPKQFYITFCRCAHQGGATAGQFAVIKDKGGVFTKTSTNKPDLQDGDHSRIHTLSSVWFGRANEPPERNMRWDPPVYFDQTVDILRVQIGYVGSDMCNFQLGILVNAPAP